MDENQPALSPEIKGKLDQLRWAMRQKETGHVIYHCDECGFSASQYGVTFTQMVKQAWTHWLLHQTGQGWHR
jgi:hypothetical protein